MSNRMQKNENKFLFGAAFGIRLHPHAVDQAQDRPFGLAYKPNNLCADLHEAHHDADDDEGYPVRLIHCRRRLNDGQNAEERGNHINDQHRLAVAESKLAQAMMQMAFVRREDRLLLNFASHDGEERIRQRHPDNNQRRNERYDRNLLEAEQGQHGQTEPKEQRAGIPHENLGGMEVKEQESDNSAQQQQAKQGYGRISHQERHDGNRSDCNPGHAGSKTVEAVNQINGIGHPDNPEDGERNRHPALKRRVPVLERYIYKIHSDIKSEHDNAGRCNLCQELDFGRQLKPVIQGSDQYDHGTADQKSLHEVGIPRRKAIRQERKHCNESEHKSQINAKPAETGHDSSMNFTGIRYVDGTDLNREFFHQRRKKQSQSKRHDKPDDVYH